MVTVLYSTTNASLPDWGSVHEGRIVKGQLEHKPPTIAGFLELSAVFLSLKCFLSFLRGHYVLMGSTTMVVYINCQVGPSIDAHMFAHRLILWSGRCLLSLRVTHVPGILKAGADLLSRCTLMYGEWTLHPVVVEQIWARYW